MPFLNVTPKPFPDANLFRNDEERMVAEQMGAAEVILGRLDGTFDPFTPVNRIEAALIAWRNQNWARLAADNAMDASLMLVDLSIGGGSGFWRGPRVYYTNRHVELVKMQKADGTIYEKEINPMIFANGGFVRADTTLVPGTSDYVEPPPHVVKSNVDPRDIVACVVDETQWNKYLDQREAIGLAREPLYINPHLNRPLIAGERIMVCGAPLLYGHTVTEGIVSKASVPRTEGGITIEYAMVTAGINPGNSGGLAFTFDRTFAGIPSLKPWTNTGFGMTHGDDMGLVLTAADIAKWEIGMGWYFKAIGITLPQ